MLVISPILKILLTILKIILKYRNYPSILTLSVGRNDIKVFFFSFFFLHSEVCKEEILKDILTLSCSIYSESEEKDLFICLLVYLFIYLVN